MKAIHPVRRYSPSVIASIPALSCSAIASSTARSSTARSSSAPIVPARAASLASRRYSGRSRLPTTSARMVAISAATIRSTGMRDVEGKVAFVTGGGSGVGLGMAKAFVARRHAGGDRRHPRRPPRGGDRRARRGRARDPARRDRPRGVRARGGRDRARPRQRPRPLQQRRDQPLQRHRRRHLPGLGLGARRQPRRRRQRRRHVRAEDQGARGARARRQHGVDGRVRRRPGRRHLHDGEVRGARPVRRAALEPAATRDRRLDGLPGPRQEQDLRERPRSGRPSSRPT